MRQTDNTQKKMTITAMAAFDNILSMALIAAAISVEPELTTDLWYFAYGHYQSNIYLVICVLCGKCVNVQGKLTANCRTSDQNVGAQQIEKHPRKSIEQRASNSKLRAESKLNTLVQFSARAQSPS